MPEARLTFLTHHLELGGGTRVIATMANLLASAGYRVDVVAVNPSTRPRREWFAETVTVEEFKHRWIVLRILELVRCLARRRDRLVFSCCEFTSVLTPLLLRLLPGRRKLVIVIHTNLRHLVERHTDNYRLQLGIKLARFTYRKADVVAAVSRGAAEDARDYLKLEKAVVTLYNPVVDERSVAGFTPTIPELMRKLPRPVILGVGRLHEEKGFETLIDAFVESFPEGSLLILGDGEDRSQLERHAETAGAAGRVLLPGSVDDPRDYMAHADLFVLSSRYEGLPTTLIEAMSTGCPVVATDCPSGPREILEDGKLGELVPVGDARALAAAMVRRLARARDSEALRRRAGDFSYANALQRYIQVIDAAKWVTR